MPFSCIPIPSHPPPPVCPFPQNQTCKPSQRTSTCPILQKRTHRNQFDHSVCPFLQNRTYGRLIMGGMAKKKHEKGSGSTPATVQLERAGVTFKTYEYAHSNDHMDDGYGVEAATKLGFDEHQVFKTLMADTGIERVVGVVPVSGHMDLKALAAAVGAKKASMADPKVAMRESGYVVGGISPLGQRTHHKTVLDESALQYDEILLSGGKRGFSIGINPNDLMKVLDAIAAPIGTW